MAEAKLRRRGHGEDAIYFAAAKNRYVGAVSLGYTPDGKRIRRKVFGRTKQEVRDKLKALHQELDAGIRSSAGCTVRQAVDDWLREGLDGRSERTRAPYEGLLEPILEIIGGRPLRNLSAGDVRSGALDLFQVAEDPLTGKAAIIYTDSTIDTWTVNGVTSELPEIVLAFEQ